MRTANSCNKSVSSQELPFVSWAELNFNLVSYCNPTRAGESERYGLASGPAVPRRERGRAVRNLHDHVEPSTLEACLE